MVLKNPTKHEKGKTIVFFVRHGDRIHIPESPEPHDFSLSPKGIKQAKEIANKFKKIKSEIDVLYSSTMKRAIETAKIIGKQIKKKPVPISGLSEFNGILWTNKIYQHKFWKHYIKHKSSIAILNKLLKKYEGKVIVIVAHGNIIKGLIGAKLGLSRNQIGKFDYNNRHASKVRFNKTKIDYINYFNSKELIY